VGSRTCWCDRRAHGACGSHRTCAGGEDGLLTAYTDADSSCVASCQVLVETRVTVGAYPWVPFRNVGDVKAGLLYKTFAVLRYRSISYQSRKRIFLERTEVRKVLAVDFSEPLLRAHMVISGHTAPF
jgi:hypothetical protein